MDILRTVIYSTTDHFQNISYLPVEAAVFLSVMLAVIGYFIIRDYGVPPGPTGVPILGFWPFLSSDKSHLQQLAFKEKYGDIFSYRVTGKLYIHLASAKVLREAHVTQSDCFRERTSEFNIISMIFDQGVLFSNGEKWQTIRKYFLSQFRERGMTIFKELTAEAMDETVRSLVDELRANSSKPIDILKFLTSKSTRIIHDTLFGLNTTITEDEIDNIQREYRYVTETLMRPTNMLLQGKFTKYVITPFLPSYKKGLEIHNHARKRFQKMINDHRRTFDGDNIRDIFDSFIQEKNTRKSKGDQTHKYFEDDILIGNLLQFVGDGIVNVATFIIFMLRPLLDHPEEQEKIYKELVDVCGEDRNPILEDKSKLKYLNAYIMEAQRKACFVPLFPNLECTKETTIGGYRIPKGANTILNVYAIHHDPQVYKDPERFNPSRFLSTDGKSREDLPVTFGVGKRSCLGESFVLMQVFMFLAAIVKNFEISYSDPEQSQLARVRALEICVKPRKAVV